MVAGTRQRDEDGGGGGEAALRGVRRAAPHQGDVVQERGAGGGGEGPRHGARLLAAQVRHGGARLPPPHLAPRRPRHRLLHVRGDQCRGAAGHHRHPQGRHESVG